MSMGINKEKKRIDRASGYQPVFYTVWQDAWLAIRQPRQYIKWAIQPFSRSVKYLLILVFVISLVSTIYFYLNLKPHIIEFQAWVAEAVPEVTYQDGLLSIEDDKPFSYTDSDQVYFKIDTTQSLEDDPSIDNFYQVGFLMTSDALLYRTDGELETIAYEEFGLKDFKFDGALVSRWLGRLLNIAFLAVPLAVFAYMMIAKLLFSAFFAFLYFMFSGFKYDFVQVWSVAIYALTPAIVAGYLSFIFAPIFGFYTFIFLIYMIVAMSHYRKFIELKQGTGNKNGNA